MTEQHRARPESERLDEAIAAYFQAREMGQPLTREELLGRYPALAEELRDFLDTRSVFERQAGPGAFAQAADPDPLRASPTPPETATVSAAPGPSAWSGPASPLFGDYELLEQIARGGMGVVYKARQISLNRVVALKMILAGQLASEQDVARFHLEAEAAAQLEHPNIVPIYEIGEHHGQHFFSMKLVGGGSMAGAVARLRHQPRETARLLARVARAVHHAHEHGLLHRDLKPANVLLDEQGEPVVTDFGLARRVDGDAGLTQSGAIVGSPAYMPPEQAMGKKGLTRAVDVWALGAILYECLTGRAPYHGSTPVDILIAVLETEPEPPRNLVPAADRDLEQICLKCLRREPEQRYASAAALADDLERWLEGKPVAARPLSPWQRGWKWAQRQPGVAVILLFAPVYVAGVLVWVGLFEGTGFAALAALGMMLLFAVFIGAFNGPRYQNRFLRQIEQLAGAIENARQQPVPPAAPASAGPVVQSVSRQDVLPGMLHGSWYGLVIFLTGMFSLHLVLAGLAPVSLWAVLRTALEGGALGAVAGAVAGLFAGARGRPEGLVAWTFMFPLVIFAGLVGPLLIPQIPNVWIYPMMMFLPLLLAGCFAWSRILGQRQGAKGEAMHQVMWLMHAKSFAVPVNMARVSILLVGCVVGGEVGFATAAMIGQTSGALLGASVFWLAAVALGWWPGSPSAEKTGIPEWRPAVLAALGGLAVLWLARGIWHGEDSAVSLRHPVMALSDVALSPDSRWLLSRDLAGTVYLWDVETQKLRHTFAAGAQKMTLSADGQRILLSRDGKVTAYALAELVENRLRPDGVRGLTAAEQAAARGNLLAAVAGQKGERLLNASADGRLSLWRFAPRQELQKRWTTTGGAMWALAASEELALSAGTDGTVYLWQLPEGTPAGQLVGHRGWVAALAVTPDGRRAVSASFDGTVRVWDLPARRLVRTLRTHREMWVTAVAISADGRLVASAGLDWTVRMWRLEE